MSSKINVSFGKRYALVKTQLEERASEMQVSASKYCLIVLTKHIASGERFKVTSG